MKTIDNQSKNDELNVSLNKLSESTNKLEESTKMAKHSNKDTHSFKSTKSNDEIGVKKVLNTLRCFFDLNTKVLLYFIISI